MREKFFLHDGTDEPGGRKIIILPQETGTRSFKSIPAIAQEIIAEKSGNLEGAQKALEPALGRRSPSTAIASRNPEMIISDTIDAPKPEPIEIPKAVSQDVPDELKTIPALAEEIKRARIPDIPTEAFEKLDAEVEAGMPRRLRTIEPAKDQRPSMPTPPAPPYADSRTPNEVIEKPEQARDDASNKFPRRIYLLQPEERRNLRDDGKQGIEIETRRQRYEVAQGITKPQLPQPSRQGVPRSEPSSADTMFSEVYVQAKEEQDRQKPVIAQQKKEEKEQAAKNDFDERRRQREERRRLHEAGQKKPEVQPVVAAPAQMLTIDDILGERKDSKPQAAGGIFGELEKESNGAPQGASLFGKLEESSKPASAKKNAEFTEIPKDKGCPNCKAAASRIIYCPYCGGSMCATCATSIQTFPDRFVYTCPHCGEEVDVKKKAN